MFILMFTRLTGSEESIFLEGTFDNVRDARDRMREEYERRVNGMGWDPEWSEMDDMQAFCGTADLHDTVRLYIFDTEHPAGFTNDRLYEFE